MRVVNALADEIAAVAFTDAWRARADAQLPRGELGMREAGMAVFFSELAHATREPERALTARRLLAESARRLRSLPMDIGLYSGAAGVAWAACHARALGVLDPVQDDSDPASEIDDIILEYIRGHPDIASDLITGIVGIGIYVLSRLPRAAARESLGLLCQYLAHHAEEIGSGIAWPGLEVREPKGPAGADGYFPIGLAHGVAGVVAFLSRVVDAGHEPWVREVVTSGMEVLMDVVPTETKPRPICPRMTDRRGMTWGLKTFTWCWGDIGVALALIHCGLSMHNQDWLDRGLLVARSAAANVRPSNFFEDASLCHGLAGTCHAFASIARMTGDSSFGVLAKRWHDETIRVWSGRDTGQYGFLLMTPQSTTERVQWPGFLIGSAGVGLALLSTTRPASGPWDSLLLMDAPRSNPRMSST